MQGRSSGLKALRPMMTLETKTVLQCFNALHGYVKSAHG